MSDEEKTKLIEEPESVSPDQESRQSTGSAASEDKGLDVVHQDIEELDDLFRRTLLDIIKSGKASPGHLNVARAYLKDNGYTLPKLAKRKRVTDDSAAFEDISEEEFFH